jgi:prepilin-type N-terminal cleavage/methylation domain-containing protein
MKRDSLVIPRRSDRRFPRAFTLIELLVVIAIISLLVSILLPSLNNARELAKQTVCAVNIRTIMVAFACYANENDGRFTIGDSHLYGGTFNHDHFLRAAPSDDPVNDGRSYGYWPLLKPQIDVTGNRITSCEGVLQPASLFCPSEEEFTLYPPVNPRLGFPWNNTKVDGHVSYGYRGISHRFLSPSEPRYYYYNFGGADTLADPRKGMIMDRFSGGQYAPHLSKYNVGFSDSSVEAIEDQNDEIYYYGDIWNRWEAWAVVDEITGCVTEDTEE